MDTMTPEVEDFLEHFGIKGMQWGVRNNTQQKSFRSEQKSTVKANEAAQKVAGKSDPTFKREVALTRKGQGIKGTGNSAQRTAGGGTLTGRITGNFTNSKGEKVSADFANAVLSKAVKKNDRSKNLKLGAIIVGAIALSVLPRYLGKNGPAINAQVKKTGGVAFRAARAEGKIGLMWLKNKGLG